MGSSPRSWPQSLLRELGLDVVGRGACGVGHLPDLLAVGGNGLALAWSGSEAVDLEASGDADDAGLIFAGGEVAGLLGGSGADPVGAVADEETQVEDLEQERGQRQVKLVRGEKPP